jgi:hypothetical protein
MATQDPPVHLTLDQWRPCIQTFQVPRSSNPVAAHIEKTNVLAIRPRYQLVNELYHHMKKIWPDRSALDFCIAIEFEHMNVLHVSQSLKDLEFIVTVLKKTESSGITHDNGHTQTVLSQKAPMKRFNNGRRLFKSENQVQTRMSTSETGQNVKFRPLLV